MLGKEGDPSPDPSPEGRGVAIVGNHVRLALRCSPSTGCFAAIEIIAFGNELSASGGLLRSARNDGVIAMAWEDVMSQRRGEPETR